MNYALLLFASLLLVIGLSIVIAAFLRVRPEEAAAAQLEGIWGDPINFPEAEVSSWSKSRAKRVFDILCVLLASPIFIPAVGVIALANRLTSRGSVFFFQKRTGRNRSTFTIVKFRTMEQRERGANNSITTTENQCFTPLGPFLRRWKLDELPQLFNVLAGDMSLVGPRPKLPEHQLGNLCCRPGITGAATIAFAREEEVLASLPVNYLGLCYHSIVLPAKLHLDSEYMARATLLSDLNLIVDTALRRWNTSAIEELFDIETIESNGAFAAENVSSLPVKTNRDEALASAD
jgi:lipopolysaccharide/colanic/teichoic acid biosynthesis glycosyltransferase